MATGTSRCSPDLQTRGEDEDQRACHPYDPKGYPQAEHFRQASDDYRSHQEPTVTQGGDHGDSAPGSLRREVTGDGERYGHHSREGEPYHQEPGHDEERLAGSQGEGHPTGR